MLSPRAEPGSQPDSEPELTRLTVIVGAVSLDVGLPADVSIAALTHGVIELANTQMAAEPERADVKFDTTKGKWTLARIAGEPFDLHRCLAEFNVCDGEILTIRTVGAPHPPALLDDLDIDPAGPDKHQPPKSRLEPAATGIFAAGLLASVTAALLLCFQFPVIPAVVAALAVGILGAIAACILGYRGGDNAANSPWLTGVSIPLIFAGSLHIVPDAAAASSLPIAFSLSGFVALVTLLVSGRGRALCTAVIVLCVLGTATTAMMLFWSSTSRTLGAVLATASVVIIYLAPRATIALSKLPIPAVPTAGEPLDDIETHGGSTVEGVNALRRQAVPNEEEMIAGVGPSSQYLTGIVVAATVTAVLASYLAVDVNNGLFWQGTAFAAAVATVLCLRGRSHHDLVQSAILIGGGVLTGFAVITKAATHLHNWHVAAALALLSVMALIAACGLVAPRLKFSPVMRRQVEILEYLAIALLFPLCLWISRLYAFLRELQI